MISAASNCCRIDFVKGSANELRMKLSQHAQAGQDDPKLRAAQQQVQSLDVQIKKGDAKTAELALAAAASSIKQLDYSALAGDARKRSAQYGAVDVRA